ncbi:hypothetical protein TRVA0_027S01112 [Trichomonascus vanleenenianus]|uniref:alpha/beta hydrolase n=1 Tax=Trichomonascus vanleenenianus TaxID=2268995 RepID=UPI003EC95B44
MTTSSTVSYPAFPNRDIKISANVYFPEGFDKSKKYPAIIVGHPGSSCKEQTSGLYAGKLAELGYITLAYDASFQGASGGEPRYIEYPPARVEDFSCAVDYLMTLDYVDENRVGVLGVCASGGYATTATMQDHRIKALATVVGANFGRLQREAGHTPDVALQTIEAVGKQRTAEARGAEPLLTSYIPGSCEKRDQAGITKQAALDTYEAVEYYTTPRGQKKGSPNKLRLAGLLAAVTYDAYHLADKLLTQPLQIIIGEIVGEFGSYRDGYELFNKARSAEKYLHVVKGTTHYDLYDQPKAVGEAVEVMEKFFAKHL